MKNFIKALGTHDLFVIQYYDKNKVNNECGEIIDYVNENGELSSTGLLKKKGYDVLMMYLTLCLKYENSEYENSLYEYITRVH